MDFSSFSNKIFTIFASNFITPLQIDCQNFDIVAMKTSFDIICRNIWAEIMICLLTKSYLEKYFKLLNK